MTRISKEDDVAIKQILYIYSLIWFKTNEVQTLIDLVSEINAMILVYALKWGFQVYHIDIRAQKIDGSTLKIFKMVIASFQVEDKLRSARFFRETFLLADISVEVVLDMLFLTFSNADVQFVEKELTWRSYITAKALPTIK